MEFSEKFNEIFAALAAAQGEMEQPTFDKKVQISKTYEFGYASLGEVQKCIKIPNKNNGLSVSHDEIMTKDGLFLLTLLTHSSGQWIKYMSPMFGEIRNDPKIFGSSKTYTRRYALYGIYNLYGQEDTDAQEIKPTASVNKSMITEKQQKTIESILKNHSSTEEGVLEWISNRDKKDINKIENLTMEQASLIIKKLLPKKEPEGEKKCVKIPMNG